MPFTLMGRPRARLGPGPRAAACTIRAAATLSLLAGSPPAVANAEPLPWRWSNPLPHGNNIHDAAVRDGVYWQVADRGRIYRSTDRTVWSLVESGTTSSLRGIAFQGNEILVCGESGLILSGSSSGAFQVQSVNPATTDWLEAIAASPDLAVAVGDEAAVYLREGAGGPVWSRVAGLPFNHWLRGVAYGAGMFVLAGEDGLIARSSDGRTWQRQTSQVTSHLNRVVFVNAAFYACGDNGVLLRGTPDATRWEAVSLGTSETAYTYSAQPIGTGTPNPLELVAGDLLLLLKGRPNGLWEDQFTTGNGAPAPTWPYYASFWDGGRFVLGGATGMLIEGEWVNNVVGTAWFEVSTGPRDWLWDVLALPQQYIAVGDQATILTSENGVDWYRESVPPALLDRVLLGVGGSSNLVVAVGSDGALLYSPSSITNILSTNVLVTLEHCEWHTNTVVVTNTFDLQGLFWHEVQPAPTANTLQGVTERDGLIVVVGDAGTVLTSRNGSTWTNRSIQAGPDLSSVAAFPGGFVASGHNGAIYFSPDTGSWESVDSGTTNWVYRTRYLGDLLLAVGQNGLIRTSKDGKAWQAAASGVTAWLTDVSTVGDRYFVCGTQGTILVSSNAVDWIPGNMITGKSLYGLAQRQGQLVTTGVEGIILRALVEPFSDVQIIDYEHDECSEFLRDELLLTGRTDQGVAIERSTDLTGWDMVGRQWFVDTEMTFTLLRTNTPAPDFEFLRVRPIAPE